MTVHLATALVSLNLGVIIVHSADLQPFVARIWSTNSNNHNSTLKYSPSFVYLNHCRLHHTYMHVCMGDVAHLLVASDHCSVLLLFFYYTL